LGPEKNKNGNHGETTHHRNSIERSKIVLICNPRAGGRWKELAEILDSEEAQYVHRIVTDQVSDIAPALHRLGRSAGLLIIYGGDGTIQQIINRMSPSTTDDLRLALIGGGTMNVTSRWCGMSRKPAENFRSVVRAFRSGDLALREVPLIEVRQGDSRRQGFTFGIGPIVRLLDEFEHGAKSKRALVGLVVRTLLGIWTGKPAEIAALTKAMTAEVTLDGERLHWRRYTLVFANVTGQINPGVEPFPKTRERDSFYCAAYAVSPRALTLAAPLLIRGLLPIDIVAMLQPASLGTRLNELLTAGRVRLTRDPRYVNRTARNLEIRTSETLYTVDGEILEARPDEPIRIQMGNGIKLAISPISPLPPAIKQALARAVDRVNPL
jgi:diacylglycerol kinase family enzyme